MDISSLKTDSSAVQSGRWIGELPECGDVEVLVRGINNSEFRRLAQKMIRALPPNKRRDGIVDPLEMDNINAICLHRHVLRDWRNLKDGDKVVAYDQDVAEKLLKNSRRFRDGVFVAASRVEEEVEDDAQATEKNSEAPSAIN